MLQYRTATPTNYIQTLVQTTKTSKKPHITKIIGKTLHGKFPKRNRLWSEYTTIQIETRIGKTIMAIPMPSIDPVGKPARQNRIIAGIKATIRIISHFSIQPYIYEIIPKTSTII
jgi:hypothetical protein